MTRVQSYAHDLRGSSFRGARLRGAGFKNCDLRGCDFTDADLTGAALLGSTIDHTTIFNGACLAGVSLIDELSPPGHRLPPLDLSVAQTDERTQLTDTDPHRDMRALMHAVERELAQHADRRWAPLVREVLVRAREELKIMPPTTISTWVDEVMERVRPEERDEVFSLFEQAAKHLR